MPKKRVLIIAVVFVFLAGFGIWSGLLTFRGICGWKATEFARESAQEQGNIIGKSWPCVCLGISTPISNSYEQVTYCTGINLSYNRFLNLPFFKSRKTPIYTDKEQWTLQIQVVELAVSNEGKPVTGATVGVYDNSGNVVKQASLDSNGRAVFLLPENDYMISMKSGYSGQKELTLDTNRSVKLRVLSVFQ